MKRLWIVAMMAMLVGCSAPKEREKSQTLRLTLQTNPCSLDPAVGADRRAQVVTNSLFEGLTRVGQDGKTELALAEAVEVSSDQQTYTFYLRPSLWSDGTPCTAHDFEYAWKRVLDPDFPTRYAYALFVVEGALEAKQGQAPVDDIQVRALDDHTFQVHLAHPAPYLLDLLTIPVCAPVKRGLEEGWDNSAKAFVCNGPFLLADYQPERSIALAANPFYWEADTMEIEGVNFVIVADGNTSLQMYERGDLDWVGEPMAELPKPALEALMRQDQLHTQPVAGVYGFNFNVGAVPFNNVKVREAFALALNRQQLVDCVLKTGEPLATSLLCPPLSLVPGVQGDGDPQRARQLLEEGFAELGLDLQHPPEIVLNYAMLEGELAISQAVQQQWEQVLGLPIKLEGLEWRTYTYTLGQHNYQVGAMTWWAWFLDPIYNLEAAKLRANQFNYWDWEGENYKALLDKADWSTNRQERRALLAEAEQMLLDQHLFAPIYVAIHKYTKRDSVEGVVLSDLGGIDYRWARIREEGSTQSQALPTSARQCADLG